jgi:hypothetical protein
MRMLCILCSLDQVIKVKSCTVLAGAHVFLSSDPEMGASYGV